MLLEFFQNTNIDETKDYLNNSAVKIAHVLEKHSDNFPLGLEISWEIIDNKTKVVIAKDKGTILKSMQSKYVFTSNNQVFKEIENSDGVFAYVGLPCQIQAARKYCNLNKEFGKKIFLMAPVRQTRYSHQLLEEVKEFTVFVPFEDMKKQTAICGNKSARDTDKIALCGFTMLPSKTVSVPHIQGKGITYECRVVFKAEMDPDNLTPYIKSNYSR
jgi:hypothetical protein